MKTPQTIQEATERQQSLQRRECKRLARKIHDEISQKMTLLSLQLSMSATDEKPPANWSESCQTWADLVMELGQAIRGVTAELQPRVTDENGLKGALRWLVQASAKKISCDLKDSGAPVALPSMAGNELFVICREIIADILVPAKAASVSLELENTGESVRLTLRVADTEAGLEALPEKSLAAIELNDRMQAISGFAEWHHTAGDGCALVLTVPALVEHPALCAA